MTWNVVHFRMSYTEWLSRGWSKDARFKAVEKNREREAMFDEFIAQLRLKEQQTTKSKLGNVRIPFERTLLVILISDWLRNSAERRLFLAVE